MSGKGSRRRPTNEEAYRTNYDAIFRSAPKVVGRCPGQTVQGKAANHDPNCQCSVCSPAAEESAKFPRRAD